MVEGVRMSDAVKHWTLVRLTALMSIPLTLWLVWSVAAHGIAADHATFTSWLQQSWHAGFFALAVLVVFYHTSSGAQEIIEDYVHHESLKKGSILALHAFFTLAALACVFFIFKIAFGG